MRRLAAVCWIAACWLGACNVSASAADSVSLTPIPTTLAPTATSVPVAATAAATDPPPAISPDVTCVPPSVMLHSKDRYLLEQSIIPFLIANHYTTLTYRDYFDILNGKRPLPGRPVILSVDDIPSDYINSYFRAMFNSLHAAGLTASIAMNPNEPPEKTDENVQASWGLVRGWSDWGLAVETHTVNHRYLPGASPPEVAFEIKESARRISVGTGRDPIALVLPYGAEDTTDNIQAPGLIPFSREANLKFLVGIASGRQISVTALPIPDDEYPLYVGRVGANKDQPGETLWEIAHWSCAIPACAHLAPIDCSDHNATPVP
jgi:peptidoglycan/xylan/chitin deacetylase (PgdA/CDA1 family)